MPCPNYQAAISVGTPIQKVNVQQKVCSVMRAVVLIILLLCAKGRDTGNPGKSSREALCPTNTIPAMDIIPATPHIGTATEAIAHTVIPGPLPIALHVFLPHGASPRHSSYSKRHSTPHRYYQDSIDVIPADSITTGSQAEGKLFMERASDGPSSLLHSTRPASSKWYQDHGCQDRSWHSSQHYPLEQVLYTLP